MLASTGYSYEIVGNQIILNLEKPQKKERKASVIQGQVLDDLGEPLIGVNVVIKGTTTGTITDYNGAFSFEAQIAEGDSLLVSYIGMKSALFSLKENGPFSIVLLSDSEMIDEVVVTALGIKREKKMLGYSIQEVKSDELNKTGDAQVSSALQGKVAGLQINNSSTGLGGSAKITIRGNSSLTDNNQPLWIVDGVPFSENSSSSSSAYGGIDRGSTSLDINPDDIESISVLKGPNAAALYGSRAGNGVILVTTKKGSKKDGMGVSYSSTLTWTTIADELDRQTTYGQGVNGVYDKKSQYSFGPKLDNQLVETWNGEQVPYSNYTGKMKEYFKTGFSHNHHVSIGTQKEDHHFRAAFATSQNDGMFQDEKLTKYSVDLNAGSKINKWTSMEAKLSLSNTKAEERPYFGVYGEVAQLMLIPNNIRINDLRKYKMEDKMHTNWTGPTTDYLNPFYVNQQRTNSDERWRAFGFYNLKVDVADWLHFSAKYAFDYYRTQLFDADLTNGTKVNRLLDLTEDNMNRSEGNFFEQNTEFLLFGNTTFADKYRVGYTLGSNFMYSKYNSMGANVYNMVYKNQWMLGHAQQLNSASESGWQRSTNSVFASLQVTYNDYLSMDLTARNDWSSTLPTNQNSYFYPSASVVYVLSDALKAYHVSVPSWITFAKVRLSAAMVGKDTDPFNTYNTISGGYQNGLYKPSISFLKKNDKLKNDITVSYEAGLDMKFFNNRLGFDFTYYYGYTKNQIMVIPAIAPWVDGAVINSGKIVNSGVEAMLYATIIDHTNFKFNLNVNLAHNVSTVEELNDKKKFVYFNGDRNFPIQVGAKEGGKLGEIYARTRFLRDDKGNVVVSENTGLPERVSDEQGNLDNPIGCIQPDLVMSVTPEISFHGIHISAMVGMKFGGNIVSVSESMATSHGISLRTENREDFVVPGVNVIRDANNEIVGYKENATVTDAESYYQTIGGQTNAIAENFVYDASFIRLKELSIGYSFPAKMLKKTPFSQARFSLVARNLCYLMKHTPGTSPEGGFDTSMFSQAIDFSSLPYSRTFGFSVNLGF